MSRPRGALDPQWQRVQDLLIAYLEARTQGPVETRQRDELFEAIYAALNTLARKIVAKGQPDRRATPMSEEVVLRVWRRWQFTDLMTRYDPSRGNAFSLFYRLLRNEWQDWMDHQATQGDPLALGPEDWELLLEQMAGELAAMPVGHPFGSLPPQPNELLERKQASDELHRALQSLSLYERNLLKMRREEDLTAADCAKRLGVSKAKVDRDLARIVKIVKTAYGAGAR
ncbi:MAG: hypothetical protein JWQ07_4093 [Ramlibacter sp.]|nr:hypothetical protein [Ramlibacter sp.]